MLTVLFVHYSTLPNYAYWWNLVVSKLPISQIDLKKFVLEFNIIITINVHTGGLKSAIVSIFNKKKIPAFNKANCIYTVLQQDLLKIYNIYEWMNFIMSF